MVLTMITRRSNIASPLARNADSGDWILPGAQNAYDGGRRALRAGFYGPARAIFGALLPHEPHHVEVGVALARTELAAGHPATAEVVLKSLPESALRLPTTQIILAECSVARGEVSAGLARAFSCTEANPRHSHGRYLMARLMWLGGQEAHAEVQFLSLATDPEVGARSCAWAVFCGWRQGHRDEVAELFANLRTDDVVSEGMREFAHRAFDEPWVPSELVDPRARERCADIWCDLYHRQYAAIRPNPHFAEAGILV